jgi:outer membrane protein assembly factor BamD
MLRKHAITSLLAASIAIAGCHHAKVQNPIANINSKQPDKVLFDRAMESMKKSRYAEARTLLDTLLTTYPESEYVARAKLSKGDAWYSEGGTAGLQEAEVEYKDFITFFPNMPEAAEAQLKVADIHYKQMEKPDRDFTQAMRAADEYRTLINQFPDSKLVPQAKKHLREVQEVLADRQWRIAHFYYLRSNLAASQARLSSLLDSYPLYSGADEALFLLGTIYEKEAATMRAQKKVPEVIKAKLAGEYDQKAIDVYSRLITRYPVMTRADDARKRLQAMKAPVPRPTPEAIAQNQAEEDSRGEVTRFQELVGNFRKHPDVSRTSEVGEPRMDEEEIQSAPALIQQFNAEIKDAAVIVGTGSAPGANAPPPGSTLSQPGSNTPGSQAVPALVSQPASKSAGSQPSSGAPQTVASSSSDLPVIENPSTAANPVPVKAGAATASRSSASEGSAVMAPKQINDIGANSDPVAQKGVQTAPDAQQQNANDQADSSSKKKKKKGFHKLIPF